MESYDEFLFILCLHVFFKKFSPLSMEQLSPVLNGTGDNIKENLTTHSKQMYTHENVRKYNFESKLFLSPLQYFYASSGSQHYRTNKKMNDKLDEIKLPKVSSHWCFKGLNNMYLISLLLYKVR